MAPGAMLLTRMRFQRAHDFVVKRPAVDFSLRSELRFCKGVTVTYVPDQSHDYAWSCLCYKFGAKDGLADV